MERNCDFCGTKYEADMRNVKRGWGMCCSKKCAARKRESNKKKKVMKSRDYSKMSDLFKFSFNTHTKEIRSKSSVPTLFDDMISKWNNKGQLPSVVNDYLTQVVGGSSMGTFMEEQFGTGAILEGMSVSAFRLDKLNKEDFNDFTFVDLNDTFGIFHPAKYGYVIEVTTGLEIKMSNTVTLTCLIQFEGRELVKYWNDGKMYGKTSAELNRFEFLTKLLKKYKSNNKLKQFKDGKSTKSREQKVPVVLRENFSIRIGVRKGRVVVSERRSISDVIRGCSGD